MASSSVIGDNSDEVVVVAVLSMALSLTCPAAPRFLDRGAGWSAAKLGGAAAFPGSSRSYRPSASKKRAGFGAGTHTYNTHTCPFINLCSCGLIFNVSLCVDPRNLEPHCEWQLWEVEGSSKVSSERNIQPIWKWPETTCAEVTTLVTLVWRSAGITFSSSVLWLLS